MNRFLLISAFLLNISFATLGQIRVGPSIGLNFTTLSETSGSSANKSAITMNSIMQGTIGCLVDRFLSDRFGIQTGIHLTWKGADFTLSEPYYGNRTNYAPRLNYIELPLSVYLKVLNQNTKVSICAGPSFSYLLASNWTTNRSGYIYYSTEKKGDLGIKLGLQAELISGLGLKLDYTIGFTEVYNFEYFTISGNYLNYANYSYSFKNRAMTVSIYYLFGGGLI
ncbi:MAG TPA: outer membrane beta-barrel protein [Bacteroidia bacterium]|nr:outer membrane beta-barrel protein [Bacteroidia bacterium]